MTGDESPVDSLQRRGFEIRFVSHAKAILQSDFLPALDELAQTLGAVDLPITEIIGSGGGETKFTQRLRRSLTQSGWPKHVFEIGRTIDESNANRHPTRSIT